MAAAIIMAGAAVALYFAHSTGAVRRFWGAWQDHQRMRAGVSPFPFSGMELPANADDSVKASASAYERIIASHPTSSPIEIGMHFVGTGSGVRVEVLMAGDPELLKSDKTALGDAAAKGVVFFAVKEDPRAELHAHLVEDDEPAGEDAEHQAV